MGLVFMLRSVGLVPVLSCSLFYFFNWFVDCRSAVVSCACVLFMTSKGGKDKNNTAKKILIAEVVFDAFSNSYIRYQYIFLTAIGTLWI